MMSALEKYAAKRLLIEKLARGGSAEGWARRAQTRALPRSQAPKRKNPLLAGLQGALSAGTTGPFGPLVAPPTRTLSQGWRAALRKARGE